MSNSKKALWICGLALMVLFVVFGTSLLYAMLGVTAAALALVFLVLLGIVVTVVSWMHIRDERRRAHEAAASPPAAHGTSQPGERPTKEPVP